MKRVFEEKVGEAKLVIVQTADGYLGTVWQSGSKTETIEHSELEVVKAALRNAAGKLHPDYVGIEGAKARFCSFFPGGLTDPVYSAKERQYKEKARAALMVAAPLDKALDADERVAIACRKGLATNLLSRFEAARLNELLASKDGPSFIRAAAAFTIEPDARSLAAMERAVMPYGRASWPILTYLPFLWSPATQMFLKPDATKDFAVRVGHGFASSYDPSFDIVVYEALLDLTQWTEKRIVDLAPQDRIDVQSFIWVVGSYTDADRAECLAS